MYLKENALFWAFEVTLSTVTVQYLFISISGQKLTTYIESMTDDHWSKFQSNLTYNFSQSATALQQTAFKKFLPEGIAKRFLLVYREVNI